MLRAIPSELAGGIALLALLAVGFYYGWQNWGTQVIHRSEYRLSLDNIEVSPQPAWIRSNVKAETARDASLENLSIFDSDLTIRVYRAFQMHAWVARVNRVSKRPPSHVIVDLVYRRPVAWVEVPPGVLPSNEAGLLPIDGDGVLLPPGDFSSEQADDYIRIGVANLTPCGLPGTAWGDPRVAGAAQIAAMLADRSRELAFHRILVSSSPPNERGQTQTVYEVRTHSGLRFIWGSAPGQEIAGEPKASQKAARLLQLAEAAAVKKSPPAGSEIDLRDPGPAAQRTARAPDARPS